MKKENTKWSLSLGSLSHSLFKANLVSFELGKDPAPHKFSPERSTKKLSLLLSEL